MDTMLTQTEFTAQVGTMCEPPKILIADAIAEAGVDYLRQLGDVEYEPEISPDALKAIIAPFEGLVVRSRTKVTAEVIAAAPNLRVIGRAGVGLDTIDLKAAEACGIRVVNTPFASTVAVAELTVGLMLALARTIPAADASMKRGEWLKKQLMGTEISGKTFGVIGLGRIGQAVVERVKPFGMDVVAVDPHLSPDEIRQRGAEPATMTQLLAQADYLSLHIPLTDKTHTLLGAAEFAQMKDGARLICCARGKIIDEEALVEALDAGKIAGAALDVFASEPTGFTQLVQHPRVIATPHIGAMTREAQDKAAVDVAKQVLEILQSHQ